MERRIAVIRDAFPGDAALDTALSRALLDAVARGARGESLRLWFPGDALAFSLADRVRPGFARAVEAARARGFAPFLRLAGGQAAVYTRATLAFAWTVPAPDERAGIGRRFDEAAELVAAALRRLGVDARVGEVPGEYCPGAHSVNARGRRKLMGVGQRLIRGAAHVGGVIVLRESARVREALEPVYAALDHAFDPATAGSLEDEIGAVAGEDVVAALLAELGGRCALGADAIDAELLEQARWLEARHRVETPAPEGSRNQAAGSERR